MVKILHIGNSHISVLIGNRPCQLLSISSYKNSNVKQRSFSSLMVNEKQPIKLSFDRQTKLISKNFLLLFQIQSYIHLINIHPFQSFISGGHQLIILGENFHTIQNIQLEFQRFIFVSPLFHNNTHLIFLTPSITRITFKYILSTRY